MNDIEKKINDTMLKNMPKVWYHSTFNVDLDEKSFYDVFRIFNNSDEYIKHEQILNSYNQNDVMKSFGRTNLDSAFHGFYLMSNRDEAIRYSKRKIAEGKLIVVEINTELIIGVCKCLCFPNLEWSHFVVNNRNQKTLSNTCKASYSMIMDGEQKVSTLVNNMINAKDEEEYYNYYIQTIPKSIIRYYNHENRTWDYSGVLSDSSWNLGKCLQLCLSSQELLRPEVLKNIKIEPIL